MTYEATILLTFIIYKSFLMDNLTISNILDKRIILTYTIFSIHHFMTKAETIWKSNANLQSTHIDRFTQTFPITLASTPKAGLFIYRMENPFVPYESTFLMAMFWSSTTDFNYFRSIYEWPLKKRSQVTHQSPAYILRGPSLVDKFTPLYFIRGVNQC